MWALSVDTPRFILFDQRTIVPSWLVLAMMHIGALASVYAWFVFVRSRRSFTDSLVPMGLCVISMGRFSSDAVLIGLVRGNGASYPPKFVFALLFLTAGIVCLRVSLDQVTQSAELKNKNATQ